MKISKEGVMCWKQRMCVVVAVVFLSVFANGALAADNNLFNDDTGNGLWSDPGNWGDAVVPSTGDGKQVRCQPGLTATINSSTGADQIVWGHASGDAATLNMTGGSLDVSDQFMLGQGPGEEGNFNMSGGTMTFTSGNSNNWRVGNKGIADVDIGNGATVNALNESFNWQIGYQGSTVADVTISGASTVVDFAANVIVGKKDSANGTLNMSGGTLNVGDRNAGILADIQFGELNSSQGLLHMTGGTINISDKLKASGEADSGIGTIHLYGGTVDANGLVIDTDSSVDITEGILTLVDDRVGSNADLAQSYEDAGLLTAYDGAGDVLIDFNSDTLTTTISAIPEPVTIALLGVGGAIVFSRRKR